MSARLDLMSVEQFRRYMAAVARLQVAARPWLVTNLDASDIAQETLLKAHAARDHFRGQMPFEMAAWLRQILAPTFANELRFLAQQKRDAGAERPLGADLDASGRRLDAWLAADQTSPSEAAGRHERAATLAAAVGQLPPDQREVVLLKHCHGLSLNDNAEQTNRTPAAVAGLLRRGLARLREPLDGEVAA